MSDLDEYLRKAGVNQVVIAGFATSVGVESTARQVYDLGFNVSFALDSMTGANAGAQEFSVTRIFPTLGQTCQAQKIIDLLATPPLRGP